MKLLLEGWRQYLTEEKDKLNSSFEEWHSEVSANLKNDGYDPRKFEKKAKIEVKNSENGSCAFPGAHAPQDFFQKVSL